MPTRTPYEDTTVAVSRSQDAIRRALRGAGAVGISIEETWDDDPAHPTEAALRFLWPVAQGERLGQLVIRMRVVPLQPDGRFSAAQRERQAWRVIAHHLETALKTAQMGLISTEDIFLSFIENPETRRTIGEDAIPRLHAEALRQLEA